MTCDHAGCLEVATVKTRFGDGLVLIVGSRKKQTFVRYCDPHFQEVERLFYLRDVTLLAQAG